jgi:hypothetical protein
VGLKAKFIAGAATLTLVSGIAVAGAMTGDVA